ncbi:acyltransferase family protein, partial [Bifidobacterium jacchi]
MTRTTRTRSAKTPAAQSANVWINIRAVLALLVIIYHSTMIYSDPDGMYPTSRRLEFSGPGSPLATVIGVGFISMMPLFFGLAGSSMVYTLRKSTSYAVLMRKKLYRLVIPWLFIGLCWSIPLRFATHNPQFQGLTFGRILWETFVTGNFSDNLWFLQVLFLMFVVTGLPYQLFRLTDRADVAVAVWSVFVFFASVAGNHVLESQGMTSKAVSSFIANLPFFVAGLLAHRQWARIRRVLFAPRVRIISIALLVVAYALMFLIAMRVSDGLVHMYAMQITAMPVPLAIAAVMP